MNSTDLEHYNVRRGARARKQGESDALFDIFGIRAAEFRVIVAAMAYYRVFGVPPMRQDIEHVAKTESASGAIRARYLEETPLKALRPTKKAWREFGEYPMMRPDEHLAVSSEVK